MRIERNTNVPRVYRRFCHGCVRITVPGFTVLTAAHFFQAGQSKTSRAPPLLMFIAPAPPRDEPTTTCGWCLSNSSWAILTASLKPSSGNFGLMTLVAVLDQEGR